DMYTLSLHDALPIYEGGNLAVGDRYGDLVRIAASLGHALAIDASGAAGSCDRSALLRFVGSGEGILDFGEAEPAFFLFLLFFSLDRKSTRLNSSHRT